MRFGQQNTLHQHQRYDIELSGNRYRFPKLRLLKSFSKMLFKTSLYQQANVAYLPVKLFRYYQLMMMDFCFNTRSKLENVRGSNSNFKERINAEDGVGDGYTGGAKLYMQLKLDFAKTKLNGLPVSTVFSPWIGLGFLSTQQSHHLSLTHKQTREGKREINSDLQIDRFIIPWKFWNPSFHNMAYTCHIQHAL